MRSLYFAAVTLSLFAAPAVAQDISESDILSRFNAQRDAFNEVRETGEVKTRNLILVTVDDVDVDAQSDSPTLATPDTSDGTLQPLVRPSQDGTVVVTGNDTLTAPSTDAAPTVSVAGATQPTTFGRLAPDLQVNLFINFAFDSATIATDQRPTLDQICIVMRDSDINQFQIVGHTDTAGTDAYNERLSTLRAEEVSRYLVSSCGIDTARITTLGLGERFPMNEDNTRADENRRVEFQALS